MNQGTWVLHGMDSQVVYLCMNFVLLKNSNVLNLTLDETFRIEGSVQVFPLEDEVHVS
jgi:hypothetical protein